jgi:hypothetical protein
MRYWKVSYNSKNKTKMKGLFKINEDSAFGPGMMFGINGPGPKKDTKGIPSDPKKLKGKSIGLLKNVNKKVK